MHQFFEKLWALVGTTGWIVVLVAAVYMAGSVHERMMKVLDEGLWGIVKPSKRLVHRCPFCGGVMRET